MADGFLGRWSQRKQAVREGKPIEKVDLSLADAAESPLPAVQRPPVPPDPRREHPPAEGEPVQPPTAAEAVQPPTPSMQDVAALNAESDFKPFVARAVAPEVRNAAMKKLFADPHFNVMDGLDTYIDDYSIPDPLPESVLRKMVSAQFLKLFDDEETQPGATGPDAPALVAKVEPEPLSRADMPADGTNGVDAANAGAADPGPDATAISDTEIDIETDKTDPAV